MGKTPKPSRPAETSPKPPVKQINTPASVSFQFIDPGGTFCLSHCTQDEIRQISDCFRLLTTQPWTTVLSSGGKGGRKTGLGYTLYQDHALRNVSRPQNMSEDIRIAAVRASRKIRVFGGYSNHIFYILWFDRSHEIVPA
jgi:hypothetical protein